MGNSFKTPSAIKTTTEIDKKYLIGSRIGRGSFGECKTCECLISKDSYAVKIVERSDAGGFWSPSAIFRREVEILISLKHENVVRYVDAMSDGRYLYLIMERCSGGELFDKILSEKRIHENDSVMIFNQVLRAIEYIHELKIVHRDIKSENFLLSSNGLIKLIDFGLSARLRSDGDRLSSIVGSAHYLAPEMLRQNYSKTIDIWSAGIMLYLMLFGRYPYEGTEEQILYSIRHKSPDFTCNWLSPRSIDFLKCLLEKDCMKRLTATEAQQHPFITGADDSTTNPDDEQTFF